jgi:hypothetical protein
MEINQTPSSPVAAAHQCQDTGRSREEKTHKVEEPPMILI